MKLAFLISLMICATLISTRHGHKRHGRHHQHGPFNHPGGHGGFQMMRFRFGGQQNPAEEFNNDIKNSSFEAAPAQTPFVHNFMHMFGRHHQPMFDRPHFATPFNGGFFGAKKLFGRHRPRFERNMPGFGSRPFAEHKKIHKIFKKMFKSINAIASAQENENEDVPLEKTVETSKQLAVIPSLNNLMIFRIIKNVEIEVPKIQDDGVSNESNKIVQEEELIEQAPVEESNTETEQEVVEENSTDGEEFSPAPALPGVDPKCFLFLIVVGKDAAAVLALIKQQAWAPLVVFTIKLVQDARATIDCFRHSAEGSTMRYLEPHLDELKGAAKDILNQDYAKAQEIIKRFVDKVQEIADNQ